MSTRSELFLTHCGLLFLVLSERIGFHFLCRRDCPPGNERKFMLRSITTNSNPFPSFLLSRNEWIDRVLTYAPFSRHKREQSS
ncbi:hypothetical protein IWZ03DRAFT_368930 [Phyllosticta citriasiana]|uniref:Secreted protein n=1 Tax=Phyllosticta citriasiana TaxID=595635 RepID=A0ABR1KTQ3_9PEZI